MRFHSNYHSSILNAEAEGLTALAKTIRTIPKRPYI